MSSNRIKPTSSSSSSSTLHPTTGPNHFSKLPDALLQHSLFGFLGSAAGNQLARTSHRFKHLPEYQNATLEFESNLRQLLWFVARGKKQQAELLISQYPELLLVEGETTDYSYYFRDGKRYQRKHRGTALELALGAEDVNLYDQTGKKLLGEGMVEMLQRHLRKLPNGEALITRQTLKQFPDGWEEQEEKEHKADLNALRRVRDAIKVSSNNEECRAAILEFINHVAPRKIITTGKHWKAKLLQAAFKMAYDEYFYDGRKDTLFYNTIIGYLQALAPANFAMAKAQGLKYLLEDGENFKRDLKYHHGAGHYYPISTGAGFRLGGDSWVDCYFGARGGVRGILDYALAFFKAMLEQKQQYCDNLCRSQTFTRNRAIGVSDVDFSTNPAATAASERSQHASMNH